MPRKNLKSLLHAIPDSDLASLARIADHFLSTLPTLKYGNYPNHLKFGYGSDFFDYREYYPGDDINNIDWRATARSRNIQIRQYQKELTPEWYICLDLSASMFWNKAEKWRLACQISIALSYMLVHLGHHVNVLLFSDSIDKLFTSLRGKHHIGHIIDFLATATEKKTPHQSSLKNIIKNLKHHASVIIISDFLMDGHSHTHLNSLARQKRQIHTFQTLSETEVAPAERGIHSLQDIETKSEQIINLTHSDIQTASEKLREHKTSLNDFCKKRGIYHTSCSTEQNWKDIVVKHIKGLIPNHA